MVANGLSLVSGTNFIVLTTSGTAVDGTLKLNGNILQIYYSSVWINLC